jgi:hypothetical protein
LSRASASLIDGLGGEAAGFAAAARGVAAEAGPLFPADQAATTRADNTRRSAADDVIRHMCCAPSCPPREGCAPCTPALFNPPGLAVFRNYDACGGHLERILNRRAVLKQGALEGRLPLRLARRLT